MESPPVISLAGKGKFVLGDSTVEASFSLYQNPYSISIVVEEEALDEAASRLPPGVFGPIQLSGTLNDGRPVKAGALYLTKIKPLFRYRSPGVGFEAFEGVSLGQAMDSLPVESRYPLTGYFDGELTLDYGGWKIKTIPCPNLEAAQTLMKKWRLPVEGLVLQLRREDATMDQHRGFARDVMTLLSLASGTGVSCHRHFFIWGNEEIEIWRHWTGGGIGPGPIVPTFEISSFLEQTLPAWQSLPQEQRKTLRLAVLHINLSALGYLDIRLFHIVLAWEFLAKAWGTNGVLPDPEACLRSRLLSACKEWKTACPNSDIDGFWGSRISALFEWPKLRTAIERHAASFDLDLKLVGLDLDLLKKARDSVAHSGALPENLTGEDKQALALLTKGQYYLQLLLLRILAYQGRVYHATSGWSTIVDIGQALTTART